MTIAEVRSIALQNNWGVGKAIALNEILNETLVVDINEDLGNAYTQIDAFSQRRDPSWSKYSFLTPRNMGKNDLWIAATAALLGLKLITADTDLNHLNGIFIEVQYISLAPSAR